MAVPANALEKHSNISQRPRSLSLDHTSYESAWFFPGQRAGSRLAADVLGLEFASTQIDSDAMTDKRPWKPLEQWLPSIGARCLETAEMSAIFLAEPVERSQLATQAWRQYIPY